MSEPKQIILVRRDLNMPPGKLAAQCAHASMMFLAAPVKDWLDRYEGYTYHNWNFNVPLTAVQQKWLDNSYAKIVLGVDDLEEFSAICQAAGEAGLTVHAVEDEGRTVLKGKTWTAAAIGPDYPEKIDPHTKHLRLY